MDTKFYFARKSPNLKIQRLCVLWLTPRIGSSRFLARISHILLLIQDFRFDGLVANTIQTSRLPL